MATKDASVAVTQAHGRMLGKCRRSHAQRYRSNAVVDIIHDAGQAWLDAAMPAWFCPHHDL